MYMRGYEAADNLCVLSGRTVVVYTSATAKHGNHYNFMNGNDIPKRHMSLRMVLFTMY